MRIVSFLPSATEIVYALGLGDQLAGVTHECDYPPEARSKPVVVRSAIQKGLTPQQIDESVSRSLQAGQSLYTVDEVLLNQLAPDLILTQDLCQVCAPSGREIERVLPFLLRAPDMVYLTPTCLADIFDNIREVGEVTGRTAEAKALVRQLQERVDAVRDRTRTVSSRPRVFCMEWLSPPYNTGHWMPELVELAGGVDGLGQKGKNSVRVAWEQIVEYAPEVLILSPCGLNLAEVLRQAHLLTTYPGWDRLPAVERGSVYAVDANSYFARPGPRVVAGVELLAHLIHPDRFSWSGLRDAYRKLNADELRLISARSS
ncbi:MAG TPA: cobalamin-binding protein [Nitrospirales bacterium]